MLAIISKSTRDKRDSQSFGTYWQYVKLVSIIAFDIENAHLIISFKKWHVCLQEDSKTWQQGRAAHGAVQQRRWCKPGMGQGRAGQQSRATEQGSKAQDCRKVQGITNNCISELAAKRSRVFKTMAANYCSTANNAISELDIISNTRFY